LYTAQKSNSHYVPQPYTNQSVFKSLLNCTSVISLNVQVRIFSPVMRQAIEFSEKTQNKGYYAIQDHSRSSRSVPNKSPCVTYH